MDTSRDPQHRNGQRFRRRPHVVVAGGGVAALEACLAVRALVDDARLTLLAPDRTFVYRPAAVADPLATRHARRASIPGFAATADAELCADRVATVDVAARRAHTSTGVGLDYDALVLATGAVPRPSAEGVVPVGEHHMTAELCSVVAAVGSGAVRSVVLVAPPAPAWRLELYELALDLALAARQEHRPASVTVVTCEDAPLAILGPRIAAALRHTLTAHGVRLVESAYVRSIAPGELVLAPGGERIAADRVLAAPQLEGPRILGLPHDADGFLPVDRFGRVGGADAVYAAGDCTSFPVKHASLAAQQADAVASAIAESAGGVRKPVPFKPVLRCMLPSRLRWYVDAPIAGGQGEAARMSPSPLWPPVTRWDSRFLSPYFARAQPIATLDRDARAAAIENARRATRNLAPH